MNRKFFFIVLAVLTIVCVTESRWGRGWRGGWHGGGHHHRGWGGSGLSFGLGFGSGWGYPYYSSYWGSPWYGSYWRRPWYYDDYYYTRPVVRYVNTYETTQQDRYTDSAGKKYWKIFNDTSHDITVTAKGHESRTIARGKTDYIPHDYSFNYDIKSKGTPYGVRGSTTKHSIRVFEKDKSGKLGTEK